VDKKLGFIGLGDIGEPMAANLIEAGFDLMLYDLRQEPLARLEKRGARIAQSPYEIGEQCNIIAIMVVDDAQVEAVIVGKNGSGVLDGAKAGSIIIIHSTISPGLCQYIAQIASAKGVGVLDAPVSGGSMGARARTLSIMVGGNHTLFEMCRPLFQALGTNIFHMGEVGTGQIGKIANNAMVVINLQATFEGLRLARQAGIDEHVMLEVAKAGSGNSWAVQHWEEVGQAAKNYTSGATGMAELAYGVMELALSIGHEGKAPMPLLALATQLIERPFVRGQ